MNSLRFVICLNTRRENIADIMADAALLVHKIPHLETFLSYLDKVKAYFCKICFNIVTSSISRSLSAPLCHNKFFFNFPTSASHVIFLDLISLFKKVV